MVETYTPRKLKTLIAYLRKCSENSNLIFRGVENKAFTLAPSLYRQIITYDPNRDNFEKIINKDCMDDVYMDYTYNVNEVTELFNIFNYKNVPPVDRFIIYTKLQHLGVKTRLLDFSFTFEVALFFACSYWSPAAIFDNKNNLSSKDGALYIVDINRFGNQIINLDDADEDDENFLAFCDDDNFSYISNSKSTSDFIFVKRFSYDEWERQENQNCCFVLFPSLVNEKYELPDNYVHKKNNY